MFCFWHLNLSNTEWTKITDCFRTSRGETLESCFFWTGSVVFLLAGHPDIWDWTFFLTFYCAHNDSKSSGSDVKCYFDNKTDIFWSPIIEKHLDPARTEWNAFHCLPNGVNRVRKGQCIDTVKPIASQCIYDCKCYAEDNMVPFSYLERILSRLLPVEICAE